MLKLADISVYQSNARLAELETYGVTGVISKASQDGWVDTSFSGHIAATLQRGWQPGAYHFLTHAVPVAGQPFKPSETPARQAEVFVQAVRAAHHGTTVGVILCLDVEDYTRYAIVHGKRIPVYRSVIPKSDAIAWMQRCRQLVGNQAILFYSSRGKTMGWGNLAQAFGPGSYAWLAAWTGSPNPTGRFNGLQVVLHQYGHYHDGVDADGFGGTQEQLRAYAGPKALPAPGPAPAHTHRLHRSTADLRARPLLSAPVAASVPSGSTIRAARGRSGAPYRVDGCQSRLWLEVRVLDGRRLPAPLWARELEWASIPASRSPTAPPSASTTSTLPAESALSAPAAPSPASST